MPRSLQGGGRWQGHGGEDLVDARRCLGVRQEELKHDRIGAGGEVSAGPIRARDLAYSEDSEDPLPEALLEEIRHLPPGALVHRGIQPFSSTEVAGCEM